MATRSYLGGLMAPLKVTRRNIAVSQSGPVETKVLSPASRVALAVAARADAKTAALAGPKPEVAWNGQPLPLAAVGAASPVVAKG